MIRRSRLKTGNEGWLTSYADLITNLLIFFMLIVSASEIQTGKLDSIASNFSKSSSTQSLSQAEKILNGEITKQNLKDEVEAKITSSGLEISFNSGLTFASGGATILPNRIEPLKKVLSLLLPYASKYKFAVEGHTDEVPLRKDSSFKSNWDLAAARALQVREYMEVVGIEKTKMRIEAYADTKPLPVDDTKGLLSDQILAKHRRVIVRIY